MNMPLNPALIEERIRQSVDTLSQGIDVAAAAHAGFLEADADYDHAFATAYMQHGGAAHEKKYAAELKTYEARKRRDAAEVQYRYAERKMRAAEHTLSAYQTLSKGVLAAYQATA